MKKTLKVLGALLVASMAATGAGEGQALAKGVDGKPTHVNLPGIGRVPYERLFEEASHDGESLDEFVARIGVKLRTYSDRTGFEACGVVAQSGERYATVIGSNHSHVACANDPANTPKGFSALRTTLHSHGKNQAVRMNSADMAFRGVRVNARTSSTSIVYGQDVNRFSEQDLRGSAGYLATEGGVIHHDGSSVQRDVKK